MNKEQMKQEVKKLKLMLKKVANFDNLTEFHNSLELIYERISNRNDKDYTQKYSASKILLGKNKKTLQKIKKRKAVVFEFVEYDDAPYGFVIIYNEFEGRLQTKIDIYIIKQ